jgi:hypothetical protein
MEENGLADDAKMITMEHHKRMRPLSIHTTSRRSPLPYLPPLILLVILGGITGTSAIVAQPKIVIAKSDIDLGTVYNGAIVRTPITISNAGTSDLHITSVRTSCGCTTVKQPKEVLKPGESQTFEVEFNSSGFRGHYAKYVYLQTDDPSADYQTVTLRVNIKEDLVPVPPVSVAWLGNIALGKTTTQSVRFANVSGHPLRLKKFADLPSTVTTSLQPTTLAPSDTIEVKLTVKPDKEGYTNQEVKLETNSRNQPNVPFRITYIGVRPQ